MPEKTICASWKMFIGDIMKFPYSDGQKPIFETKMSYSIRKYMIKTS